VRSGGRLVSLTIANDFCGHGFYRFSPELFYRFLCPGNGYAMESCIVWEDMPDSKFYDVPDPDSVQSRIELTSEFGAYMMIQAMRVGDVSREFIPLQSDYVRLWEERPDAPPSSGRLASALKRIRTLRSFVVKRFYASVYRHQRIRRNDRRVLTPLKDLRVIR
jgi:hypothetical protein